MSTVECIPYKHYPMDLDKKTVRLVKAAVLDTDGKVYTGWRHAEILCHMRDIGCARRGTTDDQGFVDQFGHYYRRRVCSALTWNSGQMSEYKEPLLSEYLWDTFGNPIVYKETHE